MKKLKENIKDIKKCLKNTFLLDLVFRFSDAKCNFRSLMRFQNAELRKCLTIKCCFQPSNKCSRTNSRTQTGQCDCYLHLFSTKMTYLTQLSTSSKALHSKYLAQMCIGAK